jgi:hypothetical protein
MLQRSLVALLLFPASVILAVGHPNPSAAPLKTHLPKVGTMIVNTYYVTDSSGAIVPKSKVDPKMDDDTLHVVLSGVALFGRSNCIELVAAAHSDTSLISYAKNGDLYMRTVGRDSDWSRLPFGMPRGKIIRKQLPNDTGNVFLKEYNMPHSRTWQVLGNDTVSSSGKIYHCVKLQIVDIREWQGRIWKQGMLYWYAPEIGYIARMNFGWDGPYFLNQELKVLQNNE